MKLAAALVFLLCTASCLAAQEAAPNKKPVMKPPALAEIFDEPPHVTAKELMGMKPDRAQRRVLKCVVMHQRLDETFMAHADGGNLILTPRRGNWPARLIRARLQAGDEVEISGVFVAVREALQMSDVIYRVTGRNRPIPAPVELNEEQLATYPHRCDLVRLTLPLRYIAYTTSGNRPVMRLFLGSHADAPVTAMVGSTSEISRDHIPDGYMLEVTGFLTRQNDGQSYVWMRTPEDIRVVGPGPAVQARRRWQWGLAGFVIIGSVGLWIALLRRQVRIQTGAMRVINERLQNSETELITNLAREKEVSDLKSSFVSMVSHEFRTPLAVILSSTELLRNHMARLGEETRRTQMDNIIHSTHVMSGMIEEVLLLGKVEGGKMVCAPVPLSLADFAAILVDENLSATKQRCPIHLQINKDLPETALADPALLRHIFSNLISNAVKYSPEGSPVDFRITQEGDNAVCVVRDLGIGIPEKDRAHLFEAFHRASNVGQRSGTGLGLVIVKRCVELHGGRIELDSLEHGGTSVRVTLPVFAAREGAE